MVHLIIKRFVTSIFCSIILLGIAACEQTKNVTSFIQKSPPEATASIFADDSPTPLRTEPQLLGNRTEESPIALPSLTPTPSEWQTVTGENGVSLQLPNDWQLIDAQKDRNPRGKWFVYELLHPTSLQFSQILEIGSLPREQESTLYLHTGEQTSLNQLEPEMHIPLEGFSPNLVVWDQSVTIREKDWHVRIQGESKAFSIGGYTFEEQDQLAKKGSLTTGSIVAVHYEQTEEFYVRLSRNLDRDMLIALDAQGVEAMIAEHLQQFMEILNSVTFAR